MRTKGYDDTVERTISDENQFRKQGENTITVEIFGKITVKDPVPWARFKLSSVYGIELRGLGWRLILQIIKELHPIEPLAPCQRGEFCPVFSTPREPF